MNGRFLRFDISSHIAVTAIVFVLALVGVGGWRLFASNQALHTAQVNILASSSSDALAQGANTDTTSTAPLDPIADVSAGALAEVQGAYLGLQSQGTYSSTSAAQIGNQIGLALHAPVSYQGYGAGDIKTDNETSYKRMLAYRAALQTSALPLLQNKDSEIRLFGMYTQTKDPQYLDQLRAAAQNYLAAASSTARITVPADAVSVHVGILNAMAEFATVLNSMADHAQDPVASVLLLQNYNQAETDMYTSFNTLAAYFKSKTS